MSETGGISRIVTEVTSAFERVAPDFAPQLQVTASTLRDNEGALQLSLGFGARARGGRYIAPYKRQVRTLKPEEGLLLTSLEGQIEALDRELAGFQLSTALWGVLLTLESSAERTVRAPGREWAVEGRYYVSVDVSVPVATLPQALQEARLRLLARAKTMRGKAMLMYAAFSVSMVWEQWEELEAFVAEEARKSPAPENLSFRKEWQEYLDDLHSFLESGGLTFNYVMPQ